MSRGLKKFEIEEVKKQAKDMLSRCHKMNDIIGTQIFSILKLYARVIYYPFGKDAPWGFTRINGIVNESNAEKPFVALNTSIPVHCQVFAAAHELYHIQYEHHPDVLPKDLLDEDDKELNEKKANRFAAEFLVEDILLAQEIKIYNLNKYDIKAVLQLAELFTVPYKAMVKRLFETNEIDESKKEELLAESEESIAINRRKYGFSDGIPNNKIVVDNLAELTVNAYEARLITYEKLEYLLEICGLKPEELNIKKAIEVVFPSDEELDEIMEGD